MQEKSEGLTTRQWILYRYLKKNYQEGVFISKKQICTDLPTQYNYSTDETRMCRNIEIDIRAINDSDIVQKIIVSNREGYKIGDREECREYIQKRFMRDFKSLKLNWKLAKKMKLDQQMRLVFNQERDTIETFMNGEND